MPTASCPASLRTAQPFRAGEEDIGDFGVTAFPTSHDVPCVGYRIHTPDEKTMTIATDLGVPHAAGARGPERLRPRWHWKATMTFTCSAAARIPTTLRSRIESQRGHLSNDECSAKLLELIQEGCKSLPCAISRRRTTPRCWRYRPFFNTLGAAGVVPEKDCIVQAQRRNEISPALAFLRLRAAVRTGSFDEVRILLQTIFDGLLFYAFLCFLCAKLLHFHTADKKEGLKSTK